MSKITLTCIVEDLGQLKSKEFLKKLTSLTFFAQKCTQVTNLQNAELRPYFFFLLWLCLVFNIYHTYWTEELKKSFSALIYRIPYRVNWTAIMNVNETKCLCCFFFSSSNSVWYQWAWLPVTLNSISRTSRPSTAQPYKESALTPGTHRAVWSYPFHVYHRA